MSITVKKMDGTVEAFDINKLKKSLSAAGAPEDVVNEISAHIAREFTGLVTTKDIYSHAFEILKEYAYKPIAARYSLKRAVFDLGPSGFPFERFVGFLFKELGYKNVKSGVYKQGKCASHELDLYAEKDGEVLGAEIKFHNSPGIKTDLKVALYVHARFEDLIKANHKIDTGWLITNTRFTSNVIKYASCAANLTLLSWDYPYGGGLVKLIEEKRIHPITALTSLKSAEKRALIERDIVLCKQALAEIRTMGSLGLGISNLKEVKEELESLCGDTYDNS